MVEMILQAVLCEFLWRVSAFRQFESKPQRHTEHLSHLLSAFLRGYKSQVLTFDLRQGLKPGKQISRGNTPTTP